MKGHFIIGLRQLLRQSNKMESDITNTEIFKTTTVENVTIALLSI